MKVINIVIRSRGDKALMTVAAALPFHAQVLCLWQEIPTSERKQVIGRRVAVQNCKRTGARRSPLADIGRQLRRSEVGKLRAGAGAVDADG